MMTVPYHCHLLTLLMMSQSGKFDRILDQTVIKHKTTSQLQYLIRFLGYGPEHDVWLDNYNVSNCSEVVKKH